MERPEIIKVAKILTKLFLKLKVFPVENPGIVSDLWEVAKDCHLNHSVILEDGSDEDIKRSQTEIEEAVSFILESLKMTQDQARKLKVQFKTLSDEEKDVNLNSSSNMQTTIMSYMTANGQMDNAGVSGNYLGTFVPREVQQHIQSDRLKKQMSKTCSTITFKMGENSNTLRSDVMTDPHYMIDLKIWNLQNIPDWSEKIMNSDHWWRHAEVRTKFMGRLPENKQVYLALQNIIPMMTNSIQKRTQEEELKEEPKTKKQKKSQNS